MDKEESRLELEIEMQHSLEPFDYGSSNFIHLSLLTRVEADLIYTLLKWVRKQGFLNS